MNKIVIAFLVIVVAVFGGKFLLEKKYESELNDALENVRLFADVNYKKVSIGWDGSISVLDISIEPTMISGESVELKMLSFGTGDRLFPLKAYAKVKNNEPPEYVRMSLKGLSFDVSLLSEYDKRDECTVMGSVNAYSAIDIERINMNGNIEMDLSDLSAPELTLELSDEMGSGDISITFDTDGSLAAFTNTEASPVDTIRATLELNPGPAEDLVAHCSKRMKLTPEQYLTTIVGSPKYSTESFGINLGKKFREKLSEYTKGGRVLSITSTPSDQLNNLSAAAFFEPHDIIRWLNLTVALDGQSVMVDYNAYLTESDGEESEKNDFVTPKRRVAEYREVVPRQAGKYKNKNVRVRRTGTKEKVEGYLLDYSNNTLSVEVRHYSGRMTYKIPVSDVTKLYVLGFHQKRAPKPKVEKVEKASPQEAL